MEKKLNEKEMQEFVNENKLIVPKNQKAKFDSMPLDKQVVKIKFYQDMVRMKEDAREKNRLINRVKDLFDKRHATVDEVKEIVIYCNDFINNARDREIASIDERIRELEAMKAQLTY